MLKIILVYAVVVKQVISFNLQLLKKYGTAKVHKLPVNGGINELPIRAIVSNLNTATDNLVKCLSKLLSPLRQLRNTVKNTKEFVEELKPQTIVNRT